MGVDPVEDVFEIPNKEPEPEALLKWRQATLVLNATRRFRYTAKQESLRSPAAKFRTSGHALMAVQRFKEAGKLRKSRLAIKEDFGDGFGLSTEQLLQLNEEASVDSLQDAGGTRGVCRALRVDPDKGISGDENDIQKRKSEFGSNTYPEQPQKSFLVFLWEATHDTTLIILMVCAVLSLGSGLATDVHDGWHDGVAIAAAVFIVIFVTAFSDYRQSLQFRGLNAEKANIQLKVLRGGRMQTASIFSLVVGDICPLSIGDQVPGDGILISGHSLTIDESSMTGESEPLHKDAAHPFLLSGCKVVDGYGTMVITAVGTNTEWGKVMATLNEDDDAETPLQVRLNGLATVIGKFGLSIAVAVLVVLFIRYAVDYEKKKVSEVVTDVVAKISIAVTIVVVAVPEGLPLAVTITLAYSMRKMMADKALVRHLAACETMGSATTICSDKTGTLTLNQMTVVQEWSAGEHRETASKSGVVATFWEDLIEGVAQNSTGSVFIPEVGEPEVTASPTEAAIISWGIQLGMDFNATRASSEILAVEAFNSTKKKAGVVVKRPNGVVRAHWKGAAEIIVENCSMWANPQGGSESLDNAKREEILEAISSMAALSLRCIALATRDLKPSDIPKHLDSWKFPESGLTLLAVVGIKDPCRPGVPEAVAICQRAGVKVRMVTGDNVLTARAIAGECGILTPNGVVIEGKEFRGLSPDQMLAVIPTIDVMARSSPTDKHLLVKMLRQMGEVVAVTGDGTNDAPALKEADIGLSMGIAGTEVAKEASDIVILDDNFTSIVKVVRWGRSVYANIQKFIQFQLTVNVVALTLNFVASCTNGEVPLTAVQLLWVNLIMDTLGALALATEMPTDDLLQQKPVGRKASLITNVMWRNLFGQAAFQLTVLMILNYRGKEIFNLSSKSSCTNPALAAGAPISTGLAPPPPPPCPPAPPPPKKGLKEKDDVTKLKNTIVFNTFVFCQLFNEINARKPNKINVFEGLLTNPFFIFILVVSTAFQIVIVELLHTFASTVSLTWGQWLACILVGAISLPLAALIKLIPVGEKPWFKLPQVSSRKKKKKHHRVPSDAGEVDENEDLSSSKRLVKQSSKSENGHLDDDRLV